MGALDLIEPVYEEERRLPAAGTTVPVPGGYTVIESLRSGGFGRVYRAYDPKRDAYVALKRLIPAEGQSYRPGYLRQLLNSARTEFESAARVRHPGLARVYAVGLDSEGYPYVAQEMVEGTPLDLIIERGPGHPNEVVEVAKKLAWTLQELHSHGVVLRDVKPGNIILRANDGEPVLIDLGVALLSNPRDDQASAVQPGTLAYMAPEQIESGEGWAFERRLLSRNRHVRVARGKPSRERRAAAPQSRGGRAGWCDSPRETEAGAVTPRDWARGHDAGARPFPEVQRSCGGDVSGLRSLDVAAVPVSRTRSRNGVGGGRQRGILVIYSRNLTRFLFACGHPDRWKGKRASSA